jgi:hypothetical protein
MNQKKLNNEDFFPCGYDNNQPLFLIGVAENIPKKR